MSFFPDIDKLYVWIGGYEMYSNRKHYWLDGSTVNVNALSWLGSEPGYNPHTHLILVGCHPGYVADWSMGDTIPTKELHILCKI